MDSPKAQGGSAQAVEAWHHDLSQPSKAWRYSRGGSTGGCRRQALVALQSIQLTPRADSGLLRQHWHPQTHMTSTSRTARCGPACRVVWQGCSLTAAPYADLPLVQTQLDTWTQQRGSRLACRAFLEHWAQRIQYQPLISTLGQLHIWHVLGGGIAHHHARCNRVAIVISAQRLDFQAKAIAEEGCTVAACVLCLRRTTDSHWTIWRAVIASFLIADCVGFVGYRATFKG